MQFGIKDKRNLTILLMFAQIVGPRGYRESYWGGKGAYFNLSSGNARALYEK